MKKQFKQTQSTNYVNGKIISIHFTRNTKSGQMYSGVLEGVSHTKGHRKQQEQQQHNPLIMLAGSYSMPFDML